MSSQPAPGPRNAVTELVIRAPAERRGLKRLLLIFSLIDRTRHFAFGSRLRTTLTVDQSQANLKPIATFWLTFSCASRSWVVFNQIFHWRLLIFSFVLIGCCDYFVFGFSARTKASWCYICISWCFIFESFRKIFSGDSAEILLWLAISGKTVDLDRSKRFEHSFLCS